MSVFSRVAENNTILIGPRWDQIEQDELYILGEAVLATPSRRWDLTMRAMKTDGVVRYWFGRGFLRPVRSKTIDLEDLLVAGGRVPLPDLEVPVLRVVNVVPALCFGAWYWRYETQWLF